MSVLAISSRKFDQDSGGAKRAADKGPVTKAVTAGGGART